MELKPFWDLRGLTKVFPGVVANDAISMRIRGGEIHGLLGENGCGKSTLIGMLAGAIQPTRGTIRRNGEAVVFRSPAEARREGVATVFQEFSLVPHLSVAENLFLGRALPTNRFGLLNRRALNRDARAVLEQLGLGDRLAVEARVITLSVAEQQLVEIAKAMSVGGTTLILDEPTAALGAGEVDALHRLLRRLKARGTSILYVSHRLEEVVDIVDKATILKDGRVVSAAEETPIELSAIVSRMIGSDPSEFYRRESHAGANVVLSVRALSAPGVRSASFELRRGEVLGVAGLLGSGRTELLRALFGVEPITGGRVELFGSDYRPKSPSHAIARGIGFVTENRKTDGLFFNLASPANTTIAALEKVGRGRWLLDRAAESVAFDRLRAAFRLTADAHATSPRSLSGGNQQKLVLGRWLFADSRVILLDEPTQGVDVGAKASIYDLVRALTREGRSILLVSSDNGELLALSDRIAVLREGKVAAIIGTADLSERRLAEQIAATSRRRPSSASEVVH